MAKKSREERRIDAEARAQFYTYENSKAKRLGTATEEQWLAKNPQVKKGNS